MFQIIKEATIKLGATIKVENIIRAPMYVYRIVLWSNVKRSHSPTLNTYLKLANKINFKQRNGKLKCFRSSDFLSIESFWYYIIVAYSN